MDNDVPQARILGVIARPLSVKVAQVAGLTATAFLAGATASSSYTLLPSILTSPSTLLLKQWRSACQQARRTSPPLVILSTIIFGWLASREPSRTTPSFRHYLAAAVFLPLCIPYSRIFVTPTENALLSRARMEDEGSTGGVLNAAVEPVKPEDVRMSTFGEIVQSIGRKGVRSHGNLNLMSVHQLVDQWGWLNLGRAILMGLSAALGAWGLVNEDLSFFELF